MKLTQGSLLARSYASRQFTNREHHLALLNRLTDEVNSDPKYFRVVNFYGLGGIGKTTLTRQAATQRSKNTPRRMTVDLSSGTINNPTDALYALYAESNIRNFPFEYACLLYTSPSPRDRQKSRMPSSA